jgi:hypothetical protein
VVEESSARNPATEAPAAEGAATEEETEIEEIVYPEERKSGAAMRLRREKATRRRKSGAAMRLCHEKARQRVGILRGRPLGPCCSQTTSYSRRSDGPDKGKSTETPILPI